MEKSIRITTSITDQTWGNENVIDLSKDKKGNPRGTAKESVATSLGNGVP
jgi:hypothetical protein